MADGWSVGGKVIVAIKALDQDRVAGYAAALSAWLDVALPAPHEVEAAARWYPEAGEVAAEVARVMGVSHEVGACIVSAFSPRQSWSRNVINALKYARGEKVPGLSVWTAMADASLESGFDALKGQKVNAFARAVAGDPDAVVIDVWMCRAAGLATDAPTVVQYREVAEAVRRVADTYWLEPATMQALIWGRVRGALA